MDFLLISSRETEKRFSHLRSKCLNSGSAISLFVLIFGGNPHQHGPLNIPYNGHQAELAIIKDMPEVTVMSPAVNAFVRGQSSYRRLTTLTTTHPEGSIFRLSRQKWFRKGRFPRPLSLWYSNNDNTLDNVRFFEPIRPCFRTIAIVLHNTASLLKSSPKGEGFSPIPREKQ